MLYLKLLEKLFMNLIQHGKHYVSFVLQKKDPQLTDIVGFGPILLFPLRHQQSPSASIAIWEQTQPSNSIEFCHPDVEKATQKKAAGRHKSEICY